MTKLESTSSPESESSYDVPTRLLGHGMSDGASAFRSAELHEGPSAIPAPRLKGLLLLVSSFMFYLVTGLTLMLHYQIYNGDAPSRVADAGYVLFSRYPHVAAVGFVWNPLPSVAEMPILLFSKWIPVLLTKGLADAFMSSAFMAGAVWQFRGACYDRGLPISWRLLIVGGFALNPMIVMYAGNGMSEAPFIFFMVWATRRLLQWLRDDKIHHLIVAALALAFGYLTRYESIVAAAAVTLLVVAVAALRRPASDWITRFKTGAIDGVVLAFPVAVTFIGWAVASWLATGVVFAQFSSEYGNTAQVTTSGMGTRAFQDLAGGPLELALRDTLYMAPLLPLVIILVMLLAVKRVEVDSLIPIAIFGSVLAFEAYAQISGQTFPLNRYFIMAVPLFFLMLILVWPYRGVAAAPFVAPPPPLEITEWWGRPVHAVESGLETLSKLEITKRIRSVATMTGDFFTASKINSRIGRFVGAVVILFVSLVSIFSTLDGMLNPTIGTNTEPDLNEIFSPSTDPIPLTPFANSVYIANYLDRLDLPKATVLIDTFYAWPLWMVDQKRKQFVITSDIDFTQALNAPYQSGIRYIVVTNTGGTDAINKRYPTLYWTGAGFATLILTVPSAGRNGWNITWRVYKVNGPSER